MAIKRIAKQLGVSQASVSMWVRDIVLSDEQMAALKLAQHTYEPGAHKGSQTNMLKHRELRRGYQEEGRSKAHERDPLHLADCMLYWAEGAKSRTSLTFVNSDPDMIQFFLKFLRESMFVDDGEITVSVICYTGNGLTVEEIEAYWLRLLQLPRSALRKTIGDVQPRSSKQRGRKLLYGMCKIVVNRSRVIQHVFGAIQEYAAIDKPEWLR
jgi:hypothetical protein